MLRELVELLPAWLPASLPMSIVYSHTRNLSPRVRAFAHWAAAVLALR